MRGSRPPTTELPGSPGRTVGRRRACSTLLSAHAESNGRRPVADATVGFTHGTEVVRVARVSGVGRLRGSEGPAWADVGWAVCIASTREVRVARRSSIVCDSATRFASSGHRGPLASLGAPGERPPALDALRASDRRQERSGGVSRERRTPAPLNATKDSGRPPLRRIAYITRGLLLRSKCGPMFHVKRDSRHRSTPHQHGPCLGTHPVHHREIW